VRDFIANSFYSFNFTARVVGRNCTIAVVAERTLKTYEWKTSEWKTREESATAESAGVENIERRLKGWKSQEWKTREQTAASMESQ